MASCLRLAVASSISCPSSSAPPPQRRRTFASINSTNIPMPPVNPNDPFLSRLASVAASSSNTLHNKHKKLDTLPCLDIFDSPQLMAAPAEVEESDDFSQDKNQGTIDLPSFFLENRIVYITLPLVPVVSELIVAQLMYLEWMDPKRSISIYMNYPTGGDYESALESESFEVYNALMLSRNEIRTLNLGSVLGQSCVLLAAGTKGKRYMMPSANAVIEQPRIYSSGLSPATDVLIHAEEAFILRDTYVKLLAKHTGNSEEVVANVIKEGPCDMDVTRAIEFGLADKVFSWGVC